MVEWSQWGAHTTSRGNTELAHEHNPLARDRVVRAVSVGMRSQQAREPPSKESLKTLQ